jgi:hypothetical protein
MKKAFIILIASLGISPVFAQNLPMDEETNKVTYTETITLDTLTRDVLFDRAKKWIITKSEDKKPDVADAEKGDIEEPISFIIKLTYDFKYKKDAKVTFDAKINEKDGKYRYIFNNFRIYDVKSGPRSEEPLEAYYAKLRSNAKGEFVSQVETNMKELTDDLKKLMEKGELVKKDDW